MQQSKFQFINPYLKELCFDANMDFDVAQTKFEMQNSFNVKIKRSEYENRANVELALEINYEKEDAPFKLKIKVASDFKWEHIETERVDAMLKNNAPALLLSYMRPIVASITNSSNFPAYNLPFMNFRE